MTNILSFLIMLVCIWFYALTAHALSIINPTETEHASYKIYYAGIPVGTVRMWWEADAEYYKITTTLKTSGIVRLFNKQKRHLELTGKRFEGEFIPIHYQAKVEYPHKSRITHMSYDKGELREVIHTPPQEDALPVEQAQHGVDPLTALLHLLIFMREPEQAKEFYAKPIYDGKRLTEGYAFPHKERIEGCMLPCRAYVLHYKPLLGYDEDELEKAEEQKPMYLLHNPDISYFPKYLSAAATLGTVEVIRQQEPAPKK